MKLLKIYFHFNAFVKLIFYKCLYKGKFQMKGYISFRKNFSLIIEKNAKVAIGKKCFFNNFCTIAAQNSVTIGDGTLFGESVKIYDHNHLFSDITIPIKFQGYSSQPIKIGNNCWIASNVVILKGVNIGDNCVIGAGCIIYKDIASNSVVLNEQKLVYK